MELNIEYCFSYPGSFISCVPSSCADINLRFRNKTVLWLRKAGDILFAFINIQVTLLSSSINKSAKLPL